MLRKTYLRDYRKGAITGKCSQVGPDITKVPYYVIL